MYSVHLRILRKWALIENVQVTEMGKRYYCDYCDKSFPDNLDQRKKHLRGVVHQRNRNQFYQSLQSDLIINKNTRAGTL